MPSPPSIEKSNIVVFGSGGHAKAVSDVVEADGRYHIIGLIAPTDTKKSVLNYPILGSDEIISHILNKYKIQAGIVAIGHNYLRAQVVKRIKKQCPVFNFITPKHPCAIISRHATIGHGSVLWPGAVVGPDVHIGNHVIIYSNTCIEHDTEIQDFCSLAPGCCTGGNVYIGTQSHIGVGTSILHGTSIARHCVIGAGSVVCNDIPEQSVAVGAPCRVIRHRSKEEKYL